MPLKSLTAKINSLAASYGPDRAAHMPATVYCHIYTDDPDNGGVEIPEATPVAISSDLFPSRAALIAAGDGEMQTPKFEWTAAEPWSGIGTWGQLSDGAGTLYDGSGLKERINVTEVGTVVRVDANIFYNEFGD